MATPTEVSPEEIETPIQDTTEDTEVKKTKSEDLLNEIVRKIDKALNYDKKEEITTKEDSDCEKNSRDFEAILDDLLIGKKTKQWSPNELIKLLTKIHKIAKAHKTEEHSFTVLSLAFSLKQVSIIKKLVELLTFEIHDSSKHGVIVNGLTPMTAEAGLTEDGIDSCLELLVKGNGDDDEGGYNIADVLDIKAIRRVESVYNRMTTTVYVVMIVIHTLYMSLFSYSSMYLMDKIRNGTEINRVDRQAIFFYVVLPLEPFFYIIYYVLPFCFALNASCKTKPYTFKDIGNQRLKYLIWKSSPMAFRLVFTVLVITSILLFHWNEKGWLHNTLSVTLLVGWLTTLSFTEGVRPLRVFWRMILQMIAIDVYKILFVYAFVLLHTLYMSLFSYSSMHLMDKIRNGTEINRVDRQAIFFYVVLPLEPFFYIIYYVLPFCFALNASCKTKPYTIKDMCCKIGNQRLKYLIWKSSPMAFRLVFTVLVITSILLFHWNEKGWLHNTLSVTLLVGWLTTLSFTEGVRPLRVFWRMILQMIAIDVYKILFVYAFVLLSFSFALHIQFQLSQNLIDEYPTPFHTMFLVYELMLGNGELFNEDFKNNMHEGGGGEVMATFLFVTYSVLATLVLVNLLIAMMNTSYDVVMKELRLSRRIGSLKQCLIVGKNISKVSKICGCKCLDSLWKINCVIKKGAMDGCTIKEKGDNTTLWFVKVTGDIGVNFEDKVSPEAGHPEDVAVKLIQELKDEVMNINQKLDILRDEVTRRSTRIEDGQSGACNSCCT